MISQTPQVCVKPDIHILHHDLRMIQRTSSALIEENLTFFFLRKEYLEIVQNVKYALFKTLKISI